MFDTMARGREYHEGVSVADAPCYSVAQCSQQWLPGMQRKFDISVLVFPQQAALAVVAVGVGRRY